MLKITKKHILNFILITTLTSFASIGLLSIRWGFYNGYIRMNYPSFIHFPVQGIDISHYQGNINWQQLDKQRIQFIFIKATEGGDFKDKSFQDYWREANKLNIPIGAYHFFTFCRSGKEQAQHFIREVPIELINLPPAIDLEFEGNCKANRKVDLLAEITNYIKIIETHYQRKVIIYATQNFYQTHLINQFPQNPIWIRDIYKQPNIPNRQWLFWQYANRGRIKGINGFVDLNVFKGSKADFKQFLTQKISQ